MAPYRGYHRIPDCGRIGQCIQIGCVKVDRIAHALCDEIGGTHAVGIAVGFRRQIQYGHAAHIDVAGSSGQIAPCDTRVLSRPGDVFAHIVDDKRVQHFERK